MRDCELNPRAVGKSCLMTLGRPRKAGKAIGARTYKRVIAVAQLAGHAGTAKLTRNCGEGSQADQWYGSTVAGDEAGARMAA